MQLHPPIRLPGGFWARCISSNLFLHFCCFSCIRVYFFPILHDSVIPFSSEYQVLHRFIFVHSFQCSHCLPCTTRLRKIETISSYLSKSKQIYNIRLQGVPSWRCSFNCSVNEQNFEIIALGYIPFTFPATWANVSGKRGHTSLPSSILCDRFPFVFHLNRYIHLWLWHPSWSTAWWYTFPSNIKIMFSYNTGAKYFSSSLSIRVFYTSTVDHQCSKGQT